MRRFLLIAAVFAVVLLYGLTVATGSSNVLSDYFWWIDLMLMDGFLNALEDDSRLIIVGDADQLLVAGSGGFVARDLGWYGERVGA